MSIRPIRISINALGGQGGGTLADWIVAVAEAAGWTAQATSVPGVAQRTGATVYYIEICPPSQREPVLSLTPVPGDVDVVLALELMEAGRAIARGLVTPDRTTLIASNHRIFAISEKSARGDGAYSSSRVLEACSRAAKHLLVADLESIAQKHHSVISAASLGALAASRALPFETNAFREAIAKGDRGVKQSLAAFEEALIASAEQPLPSTVGPAPGPGPTAAQLEQLPASVRSVAQVGGLRAADYQGKHYAAIYVERVVRICAAEAQLGQVSDWRFSREAARRLALWMTYEDVIRVADLKIRRGRFTRIGAEARTEERQIVRIVDFMHPRFEEFCDVLPRAIGTTLANQRWARRGFSKLFERDWKVATSRLRGFLLLGTVSALRPLRPVSRRYADEQARIEAWLESAVNAARTSYELGVEVLRLQRLVRGYGDTYSRGLQCFSLIMNELPRLMEAPDAAARVHELHEAALREDDRALNSLLSRSPAG